MPRAIAIATGAYPLLTLVVLFLANSILRRIPGIQKLAYVGPDGTIILFLSSILLTLTIWIIFRIKKTRALQPKMLVAFWVVLNALGVLTTFYLTGSLNTGKARWTLQNMEALSGRINNYQRAHAALPESLDEVGVNSDDVFDAWNCRLSYKRTQVGFELISSGEDRSFDSPGVSDSLSKGKDIVVRNGELIEGPLTLLAWAKERKSRG